MFAFILILVFTLISVVEFGLGIAETPIANGHLMASQTISEVVYAVFFMFVSDVRSVMLVAVQARIILIISDGVAYIT